MMFRYRVTLNGQYYAIKVLEDNNNMLVLQREIAFQIRSQCQNIVMFYDTYLFDRKIWVSGSYCYSLQIVMEYLDRGSLADLLDTQVAFPEEAIAYVTKEVLQALFYMHQRHEIHRGTCLVIL